MHAKRALAYMATAAAVLAIAGCDSRSSSSSSGYSPPVVPARYATDEHDDHADGSSDEARHAKSEFEDAAGELRSAVQALSYAPWDDQMGTIRTKLDGAEEALERLEALRPSDPSVQSARDEVDRMRSHIQRLQFENWRAVRPDMDNTSSSIEDQASSVSTSDDDD